MSIAPRAAWLALGAAVVAQAAVSVVEQGIPTLAPFIKDDLGLSAAAVGLAVSAFNLGRLVGSYPAGRAVDVFGERRMMVAGGLVAGALVALASPLPFAGLLVLLVLGGLVAAGSTPAGSKLVVAAFPFERRAFAIGVRQTAIPVGGLTAALLLPFVAEAAGWRAALAVAAGLTVAGALVALAASGGLADRSGADAAPRRLRDPQIVYLTVWGSLLVLGQYAILAHLVLDVSQANEVSVPRAAFLLAVAQAGGIAGRLGWGALSDGALAGRRRPLVVVITAIGLVAAVLLALLPGRASLVQLAPVAFLAGISLMGWNGMWVTVMSEIAGPARSGAAVGFGLTFVSFGTVAGPPLFGLVADLSGGYTLSWLVLAVLVAAALVPASLVREPLR